MKRLARAKVWQQQVRERTGQAGCSGNTSAALQVQGGGHSALPKQHWRGKGRGHGSWCGGEPYYSKEGNAYSGGYKDAAQFEEDLSCHRGGDRLGATLLKPKLAKKK